MSKLTLAKVTKQKCFLDIVEEGKKIQTVIDRLNKAYTKRGYLTESDLALVYVTLTNLENTCKRVIKKKSLSK